MQELVDRLIKETGLTEEQAKNAIVSVIGYVKEKFPMLEGAVDQIFGKQG